MEILTSVRRLYISFKSLVNDFVYSFGRAAVLLLVEVYNHTVPVRERRRIRVNYLDRPDDLGLSFCLKVITLCSPTSFPQLSISPCCRYNPILPHTPFSPVLHILLFSLDCMS